MLRLALAVAMLAFLEACSTTPMTPPNNADTKLAAVALAPAGKLRAAINFGNPVLAAKDAATGEARGVSVDLARELGRRLGVPVELVSYDAAGKVVEALKSGAWDVAFLAIDPVRAAEISYTPPYVVIEGVYLVPRDSLIRSNEDVDRPGVRVAVATGSAYDLYLSRVLKQATLVRTPTSGDVTDLFVAQKLEVRAGVKQQLEADARRIPGLRLLEGRFMVINQAMGAPRGREAGARYLRDFIEQMKASGFVAASLARNHVEGAAIAPAGDAR
ncbi:ABC transporter substrate-binding protein [Candidatus Dependentiae bacterium]|nr:ABC transporter substrate-binding protein [Candidatus Dependentiae bacterium]